MDSKGSYGKILKLAIPILIGQVGMIVTGFADTIMVGRYSTEALASASFVNNVFNLCVFACIGFTYGITPLVGALYGRGEKEEIGRMMKTALMMNVGFVAVVCLIMTFIYRHLEMMGQPEELLPFIRPYFIIYIFGLPAITLFNVFAQWSYAVNDTRMPMWIILFSNCVNIFGNWVLIYGHFGMEEMGLTGAGIATLIARWICPFIIIVVFILAKKNRVYRRGFRKGRIERKRVKEVNKTSWPVAGQMAFESGSFTIAAIFTGWLGAIPLAAYQIIVIIGTLGFCIYYSIGSAISVVVSNAAGVGDCRAERRAALDGYVITLLAATISSLVFILAARPLMHLFTNDERVLTTAVTLVFPLLLYQLGDATQITYGSALRGTSKVMPILWISFLAYIVIGVPATWFLGIHLPMGVYGIVLSFSVSLFLAAIFYCYYFYKYTKPEKI